MTKIVALSAGLSEPSSTRLLIDKLADDATGRLRADGQDVQVTTIELRELAQSITNNLVVGYADPELQSVLDAVAEADGLIVASPIFKASYNGLFKMFMDVMDNSALIGKPVLLAATGGTPRHSLAIESAMRPLFAYMQAFAVPTGVYASSEDWGASEETGLSARIARAGREFAGLLAGTGLGRVQRTDNEIADETALTLMELS
ncbi:FMN reductase [Spelaeicoccus albus]|uniref:FMN reductase n=1 Tax=Spelaeicoccus albus TaxID=1280376 RepID=A0A7Z0D1A8_9MICO|nr:FMN reductase [Spelaeicoccus albus]NYI65770.1 FMN reductase [Spelaeicoccus albus]